MECIQLSKLSNVILQNLDDIEIWRPVKGYEDTYEVSDYGRVRRIEQYGDKYSGYIMAQYIADDGYVYYRLTDRDISIQNSWLVHGLVAESWLGDKPGGKEINHRDGNKQNNCVWNLEYVTHSDNCKHAVHIGIHKIRRGSEHSMAKLSNADIEQIRELYSTGDYTRKQLREMFGVCKTSIANIVTNKSWKSAPDYTLEKILINIQILITRIYHIKSNVGSKCI